MTDYKQKLINELKEVSPRWFEIITKAKFAYIIQLSDHSPTSGLVRYSMYFENIDEETSPRYPVHPGQLIPLWPRETDPKKNKKELDLLMLDHTTRKNWPAYHIAISGFGFSKTDEIQRHFRIFNPKLAIYKLSGYQPEFL